MFDGNNSIFTLITALSIFHIFKDLKISYSRVINIIGSTTFGVYLIHGNPIISRWWWNKIWNINKYVDTNLLFPYMILATLGTFICCAILEKVRQFLFSVIAKGITKIFQNSKKEEAIIN